MVSLLINLDFNFFNVWKRLRMAHLDNVVADEAELRILMNMPGKVRGHNYLVLDINSLSMIWKLMSSLCSSFICHPYRSGIEHQISLYPWEIRRWAAYDPQQSKLQISFRSPLGGIRISYCHSRPPGQSIKLLPLDGCNIFWLIRIQG